MVDQHIMPGTVDLEIDNGRASGWNADRLHVGQRRRGHRPHRIDMIEDLADEVEGRGEIGAADTEEYAHRLTRIGIERLRGGTRADRAVEEEVLRLLGNKLVVVHLHLAIRAEGSDRVDFALDPKSV